MDVSESDVGQNLRSTTPLPGELKHCLLTNPYRPAAGYNFSGTDLAKNVFGMLCLNSFLRALPHHIIL